MKGLNRYFWRQTFVLSAGMLNSMSTGTMLAFPSVLNPYLLSPISEITASPDQVSWIGSCNGLGGALGFFIIPPVMQIFGRKIVYILVNTILAIGWIMMFFSMSVSSLIVARFIQGVVIGGIFINSLLVSEYSHPKRRGYFLAIKKSFVAVGYLFCHSMAFLLTWRQIAVFSLIAPLIAILLICFWPESPSFLALKGRFDDCEKSFVWLHGNSPKSQKELKDLISAQKVRLERKQNEEKTVRLKFLKQFIRSDFQKPFVIVTLLTLIIDACGKYYLVAFYIQIIIELTGDKSIAVYCAMVSDCLAILALFLLIFIVRLFKIRTILFTCGGFSIFLMFSISLIAVFKYKFLILSNSWLVPCILLFYSFITNLGVIPICLILFGEIFPLEYRGAGLSASGVVLTCFYAVTMKTTPLLMESTGLGGTLAVYAVILIICFVILYFILPETKDKTLQEIEDEIKGVTRSTEENEQMIKK